MISAAAAKRIVEAARGVTKSLAWRKLDPVAGIAHVMPLVRLVGKCG